MTDGVIFSKTIKTYGLGESSLEDSIKDMIGKQNNPTIAPYAKTGEVHLRITAKAKDKAEAEKLIDPVCEEMKTRFGKNIYTMDEQETLEENIVNLLKSNGLKLTTAESCTGGLLAGRIINVSGASDVFDRGFVTYSNEAKRELLNVKKETLDTFGAVSEETAKEMAVGAAVAGKADVAVSVTGIAGPGGGTKEKPVGLVYIGCHIKDREYVRKCLFYGNRQTIRENSVANALGILRHCLTDYLGTIES